MHICSRREGGILGERLGDVVVCAVHIVVFLLQSGLARTSIGSGHKKEREGRTLVRTLYSQFKTCCWTGIVMMLELAGVGEGEGEAEGGSRRQYPRTCLAWPAWRDDGKSSVAPTTALGACPPPVRTFEANSGGWGSSLRSVCKTTAALPIGDSILCVRK